MRSIVLCKAPVTNGIPVSNYSTGSTEVRTFLGATARRTADSGE